MHSHARAWERGTRERGNEERGSVGTRNAGAWERGSSICIPTRERGNEERGSVGMRKFDMHSHAGAWERGRKFNKQQRIESDFDREVKKLLLKKDAEE